MSSSIITRFDIEKLSSSVNFSIWQQKVKDILIEKDVVEAIEGSKPDDMKDAD